MFYRTNPDLAAKYVEAMQKYLDCGHFEKSVPGASETVNDNYVPIFSVERTKNRTWDLCSTVQRNIMDLGLMTLFLKDQTSRTS